MPTYRVHLGGSAEVEAETEADAAAAMPNDLHNVDIHVDKVIEEVDAR